MQDLVCHIMHDFIVFTVWQSEDISQRNKYKKGYRWNIFCKKGKIPLTIVYSEPQTTEKEKKRKSLLLVACHNKSNSSLLFSQATNDTNDDHAFMHKKKKMWYVT